MALNDQRATPAERLRNGHDFGVKVAIEDQLPVSESEDIVVEMLPSTTPPTCTTSGAASGLRQSHTRAVASS